MSSDVKVRIAPSPTGDWHLGNARTALFSYLFARYHDGQFYLRIEDTDQSRLVPGAVDRLLEILDWLDITPDSLPNGEPYFVQSKNLPRYKEIAEQLVAEGYAYYCFATTEELEAMRKDQEAKKLPPRYDNRWGYRDLSLGEAKVRVTKGDRYVIRQKMPRTGETKIIDLVRGEVTFENKLLDDHVILKADGFPTYHLAHVVDDHDMAITHVIRGDEWLPSAPRHVVLHEALGWNVPAYAHVPVILGPDKGKLSKRHGAKPVIEYKESGYLPDALANFLLLLGWSSGTEKEFFTRDEMIHQFDFARVQPSPAVFDKDRLDWFNASYIRSLPPEELTELVLAFYAEDMVWQKRFKQDGAKFIAVVAELQTRMVTLTDWDELAAVFYEEVPAFDLALVAAKKQTPEEAKRAIDIGLQVLEAIDQWHHDTLENELRSAAEANNLKAGELLWPLRVALTGLPASPGVFEMLTILGKDESIKRIRATQQRLS